eukprot:COSAG01_NODE_698_length_14177_cov_13.550039_18_plen_970_part_00
MADSEAAPPAIAQRGGHGGSAPAATAAAAADEGVPAPSAAAETQAVPGSEPEQQTPQPEPEHREQQQVTPTEVVAIKAEMDAKEAAHAATLTVGAVVTWKGSDDDIPEGTAGEIVEIKGDGTRRVKFPAGIWSFRPAELVLATPEQAAQWAAVKVQQAAQEQAEKDAKAAAARRKILFLPAGATDADCEAEEAARRTALAARAAEAQTVLSKGLEAVAARTKSCPDDSGEEHAELVSVRQGLEAIERAVQNAPADGYAAAPQEFIERVARKVTWADGERWAGGAAFNDIGATLASHLPLGKDGMGCRPTRLDATAAGQPDPPALAVAAGRKNSFAMIILATVFAGGWRADWAGNFVSLVVGSYASCCELHLAAVKGGAACDCEIAFIVSLMPALGFAVKSFAEERDGGKRLCWSWEISRPESEARPLVVRLTQYQRAEYCVAEEIAAAAALSPRDASAADVVPEAVLDRSPNLWRIATVSAPAVDQQGAVKSAELLNERVAAGLQLAYDTVEAAAGGGAAAALPEGVPVAPGLVSRVAAGIRHPEDGSPWLGGANCRLSDHLLRDHLPLGDGIGDEDGHTMGSQAPRIDPTWAPGQRDPPALEVASTKYNTFATKILATVPGGEGRADWAHSVASLIVDGYHTCTELIMMAVKGGAACAMEIAFLEALLPALGFAVVQAAAVRDGGRYLRWRWRIRRPGAAAQMFRVYLFQYARVEHCTPDMIAVDAMPLPRDPAYDGPEVPVNRAPNLTRIAAVSAPAAEVAATLNRNLGLGLQLARARAAAAGVNGGFWPENPHEYGTPAYEEWNAGEGPRLQKEYKASAELVRHGAVPAGKDEAPLCFVKPGDPANVYSLEKGQVIGPRDATTMKLFDDGGGVLETPVPLAQWAEAKAAHAATLTVGAVVTWTGSDDDIPEGTAGEIVKIQDNERRRVKFPAGIWSFAPAQLVLATPEQAAQWAAAKAELEAKEAE